MTTPLLDANGLLDVAPDPARPYDPGTPESLSVAAGAAISSAVDEFNPLPAAREVLAVDALSEGARLPADEARRQVRDAGLDGVLTVPDQGMSLGLLHHLIDRKREKLFREGVLAGAPQTFAAQAIVRGAGFAAMMADPIGLAIGAVPVVGQARYLSWLRAVNGFGARSAVRFGTGALTGAAFMAAVEPVVYASQQADQNDYDMSDALEAVAMGSLFGATIHTAGGSVIEGYRAARGQPGVMPKGWERGERYYGYEAHGAPWYGYESRGVPTTPADVPRGTTGYATGGSTTQVRIGADYVPAQWAVVDAADLSASVEKGDAQYRDRTREAYLDEEKSRALGIDYQLLNDNGPLMDVGAPTVAKDGKTVIGGNGRVLFIRRAYAIGTGSRYRAGLEAELGRYGLDASALEGKANPVLVRVLQKDVDIKRAAAASNEGGSTPMSMLEQAKVDASRLGDLSTIETDETGNLNRPANRGLIAKWIAEQPENQRNALLEGQSGALSATGLRRLGNAVLFHAFGDSPTLGRLIESNDPGSRNIVSALTRAAPRLAQIRAQTAAGTLHPHLDLLPDLVAAVEKLNELRRTGETIEHYLGTGQVFGDEMSPASRRLLQMLSDKIASPAAMARILNEYADAVERVGAPDQVTLFGEEPPTADALLANVLGQPAPASELFDLAAPETKRAMLSTAVAQVTRNEEVDVAPVLAVDRQDATPEVKDALATAADRAALPENRTLVDPEASARAEETVAAAPKGIALEQAKEAMSEADTQLADLERAGDDAYKFSRPSAPQGFYSAAIKAVEDLPQTKASPAEWLGILNGLRQKGVKGAELEWLGVEDFLRDHTEASVTKAEVAHFMRMADPELQITLLTNEQARLDKARAAAPAVDAEGQAAEADHEPGPEDVELAEGWRIVEATDDDAFAEYLRGEEADGNHPMSRNEWDHLGALNVNERPYFLLGPGIERPDEGAFIDWALSPAQALDFAKQQAHEQGVYVDAFVTARAAEGNPRWGIFGGGGDPMLDGQGQPLRFHTEAEAREYHGENADPDEENDLGPFSIRRFAATAAAPVGEPVARGDQRRLPGDRIGNGYTVRPAAVPAGEYDLIGSDAQFNAPNGVIREATPEEITADDVEAGTDPYWVWADDSPSGGEHTVLGRHATRSGAVREAMALTPKDERASMFYQVKAPTALDRVEPNPEYSGTGYNLRGGENYREALFRMNSIPFTAPHFNERRSAGLLFHSRVDDRTTADGLGMVFAQEGQSDLFQAQRKFIKSVYIGESRNFPVKVRGVLRYSKPGESLPPFVPGEGSTYTHPNFPGATFSSLGSERLHRVEMEAPSMGGSATHGFKTARTKEAALAEALQELSKKVDTHRSGETLPNAPFSDTEQWTGLWVKQMVLDAVRQGKDMVGWTPGDVQVQRWNSGIRQKVDQISWKRLKRTNAVDGTTTEVTELMAGRDGTLVFNDTVGDGDWMTVSELPNSGGRATLDDVVGEKMAERIRNEREGNITGDDLALGAEGFRQYYDVAVPSTVKKLFKRYGVVVEKMRIPTPDDAAPDVRRNSYQIVWRRGDHMGQILHDYNGVDLGFNSIEAAGAHMAGVGLTDADVEVVPVPVRKVPRKMVEVWGFRITPELRKVALEQGFSKWSQGGERVADSHLDLAMRRDAYVNTLHDAFGDDGLKLYTESRIQVVHDVKDLPPDPSGQPIPENTKGAWFRGQMYVVARNVEPGMLPGLVLHEAGEHGFARAYLGTAAYAKHLDEFDRLLREGDEDAWKARARVPHDTPARDVREESVAYFVEYAKEAKLAKRIIAAARAWVFKVSGGRLVKLTQDDFRAIAVAALRHGVNQRRGTRLGMGNAVTDYAGGEGMRFARGASPIDTKREMEPMDEALKRAELYAKAVRAAAGAESDEGGRASMKAAAPDLTAGEIDSLLEQLKVHNARTRSALRTQRNRVAVEDTANALQTEAMRSADVLANNIVMDATIARRNAALSLAAVMRGVSRVTQQFPTIPAEGIKSILGGSMHARLGARDSVSHWQSAYRLEWVQGLIYDLEQSDLLPAFTKDTHSRDLARALWQMGQAEPKLEGLDKDAVTLAQKVYKFREAARLGRNRFGAWIRELHGYIVRQSHDQVKIGTAGKAYWLSKVMPGLDVERTLGEGGGDVREFLDGVYAALSTGQHHMIIDPSDVPAIGQSGLAKRISQSRVLYFKDADAELAYLEEFGIGSLHEAIIGDLSRAAQQAGLLRVLGPNPRAALDRIRLEVESRFGHDPAALGEIAGQWHATDALMDMVDGKANIPGNATVARVSANLRGLKTMVALGSSIASQFPDVLAAAAAARYQGRGFLSGALDALAAVVRGVPRGAQREVLGRIGSVAEGLLGGIGGRFDMESLASGRMSDWLRTYFKLNLTTPWTDRIRDVFQIETSAWLGHLRDSGWETIGKDAERVLEQYGIDAHAWEAVRLGSEFVDESGRHFLTPEGVTQLPDVVFETFLERRKRTVSPAAIANARADLAARVRMLISDQAYNTAVQPDARTRLLTRLNSSEPPGTPVGEALRFVAQFKTFPVAWARQVLGREIYGRGYDTVGQFMREGGSDVWALAGLIAGTTLMGYVAMASKDIARGTTPRDPLDYRTMVAAMVQGGGLGVYGDFLLGQTSRSGRSLLETAAGPVPSLVADLDELRRRMMSGDDVAASSLRLAITNTPGANLFYIKPLLDYLVLYRMQESMNPGYLLRMERRVETENGQRYFVPPSEVIQ